MEKKGEQSKERAFEKIIEAETAQEFDSALGAIDTKVSEVVGKNVKEDAQPSSQTAKKDDQKGLSFAGISQKIAGLLGGHPAEKKIVLPSKKVQQKQVVKALEGEVKRLVRETQRIQNSKNFSPAKLEKLLQRIRHLQKMMADVVTLASQTLEQWYRKLVVKKL